MNFEERKKYTIEATRHAYKEIDETINALRRQKSYMERQIVLLKALNEYAINDEFVRLDLLLEILDGSIDKVSYEYQALLDNFEGYLQRCLDEEKARKELEAHMNVGGFRPADWTQK